MLHIMGTRVGFTITDNLRTDSDFTLGSTACRTTVVVAMVAVTAVAREGVGTVIIPTAREPRMLLCGRIGAPETIFRNP